MDWRTSDDQKRHIPETDRHLEAGSHAGRSLAFPAIVDRAAHGAGDIARPWLDPALVGDLQLARRHGGRFGLTE